MQMRSMRATFTGQKYRHFLFEKMAESLLAAIVCFLSRLVGREEAGQRSLEFDFSFILKSISE